MGTFIDMLGTVTIPEENRPELARRLAEIFRLGGMLQMEPVQMYGKELHLLCPLEPKGGSLSFFYNYFGDDFQEFAGYEEASGHLWSNKVGWRQFGWVMAAAYLQEELLSETPCFYKTCGSPMFPEQAAGWLNHLFGEYYDLALRRDVSLVRDSLRRWVIAQGQEDGTFQERELMEMILDEDSPRPIPPLATADFLMIHQDDLLYYWTKDGDIQPSDESKAWFLELRDMFDKLMAEEMPLLSPQDFLRQMMEDLDSARLYFHRIYAFREMFYEFQIHAGERRYQVWWRMFQLNMNFLRKAMPEIASDWEFDTSPQKSFHPARMILKQYLALMANVELRRDVFGV